MAIQRMPRDCRACRLATRLETLWPHLPAFVPELLSRWLFSSKLGEFGASWHVQQAPDEMQALAGDLRQMVLASSLPVPALRKVLELPYSTTLPPETLW